MASISCLNIMNLIPGFYFTHPFCIGIDSFLYLELIFQFRVPHLFSLFPHFVDDMPSFWNWRIQMKYLLVRYRLLLIGQFCRSPHIYWVVGIRSSRGLAMKCLFNFSAYREFIIAWFVLHFHIDNIIHLPLNILNLIRLHL